jgi:hypothetical protein
MEACALLGNLNSFVFDYVTRQKLGGGNMNFFIVKQLPALPPSAYKKRTPWLAVVSQLEWLYPRVFELIYTALDMQGFAYDCGYNGPPFKWDDERRFLLRCELDAAYFHLYDIDSDDLEYIMETFLLVKRKEEQEYGEYRTKRVILECYDAMAKAMEAGQPYKTILDPPPADPRVAHPAKEQ